MDLNSDMIPINRFMNETGFKKPVRDLNRFMNETGLPVLLIYDTKKKVDSETLRAQGLK